MANRFFNQFRYSLEKSVVDLYAQVTVATGTPTLVKAQSKGIASITDNGVGDWTITLVDKYNALLFVHAQCLAAAGTAAATRAVLVKAADVKSAKTINFIFSDLATPTITDPADGTVFFHFALSNSSAL